MSCKRVKNVCFPSFLAFVGRLILVYLGLEGLGVFLVLVFGFSFVQVLFCLFWFCFCFVVGVVLFYCFCF